MGINDAIKALGLIQPGVSFRYGLTFVSAGEFDAANFAFDLLGAFTLTANEVELPQTDIIYETIPTAGLNRGQKVALGYETTELVIRKPMQITNDYYQWFKKTLKYIPDPFQEAGLLDSLLSGDLPGGIYRDCFIQVFNSAGNIIKTIMVTNCRPKSIKANNLNALEETILLEELTLVVTGQVEMLTTPIPTGDIGG